MGASLVFLGQNQSRSSHHDTIGLQKWLSITGESRNTTNPEQHLSFHWLSSLREVSQNVESFLRVSYSNFKFFDLNLYFTLIVKTDTVITKFTKLIDHVKSTWLRMSLHTNCFNHKQNCHRFHCYGLFTKLAEIILIVFTNIARHFLLLIWNIFFSFAASLVWGIVDRN